MKASRHPLPPYYCELVLFLDDFRQEMDSSLWLDEEDRQVLEEYYQGLWAGRDNPYRWLGQVSGMCRRIAPVLDCLGHDRPAVTILDAGCGTGTFAIFFACQGADVLGTDINEKRLAVAQKRPGFYAENGRLKGKVDFAWRNVFSVLEEKPGAFDIIWLNEAISHMDPVTKLLDLAYHALEPRGRIVISDRNGANALIWLALLRERGFHLYTERQDPETGGVIRYAIERVFSVRTMRKLLTSAGFRVPEVIAHSYVPVALRGSRLYPSLFRLEEVLRQMPTMKHLAGSYTIVATKD